ncbi:hypothetical protein FQR65_LT06730 [Abscondita terminalis]|nr:hypothetical protein FQR65_LT06730 [Abscondita terminalis]
MNRLIDLIIQATPNNISCYQCIKHVDEECPIESLKPCPTYSDRCVKHISKTADKGFTIKRECGLGPCGFDDLMTNRGLGMDNCDRSSDEYFCYFAVQVMVAIRTVLFDTNPQCYLS